MQAGHFYLGDAGYGKDVFLLVPDRGVRYHLREWIDAKARPTNPTELFNLRYSIVSSSLSRVNGSSFVHGSDMDNGSEDSRYFERNIWKFWTSLR